MSTTETQEIVYDAPQTLSTAIVDKTAPETLSDAADVTTTAPEPFSATPAQADQDDTPVEINADSFDYAALGFDEKSADAFIELEGSIIVGMKKLYGGSTIEHAKLGKKELDALRILKQTMEAQRKAKGFGPKFEEAYAYNSINRWAVIASRGAGIGYGKVGKDGREKTFNAASDVRGYLFIEEAATFCTGGRDALAALPWGCLRDHFLPLTTFNAGELTFKVKGETPNSSKGWPEFIKTWVAAYPLWGKEGTPYEGMTDYRGSLKAAIEEKLEEIADERKSKLTEEQKTKEEQADKLRKKNALKEAARKGLQKYVAEALIHLTPEEFVKEVVAIASGPDGLNVDLPFTAAQAQTMKMETVLPLVAKSMTTHDAETMIKEVYSKSSREVMEVIANNSGTLVKMMSASPAQVKIAS